MIRVTRGDEPPGLATTRESKLRDLRALNREPTSDEVTGYRKDTVEILWERQHHKCCWCEGNPVEHGYKDVDHYRPKAEADRSPGCVEVHGYWWLAFNWDNLLFACQVCNRSHKRVRFPLQVGSTALRAEEKAPGREQPLLLDPAHLTIHPATHIEFVLDPASENCKAQARGGSVMGYWSFDQVLKLNRDELLEIRSDHIRQNVLPDLRALAVALGKLGQVDRDHPLQRGLAQDDRRAATSLFQKLRVRLGCKYPFVAASRDVCEQVVPNEKLKAIRQAWPRPEDLPLPST